MKSSTIYTKVTTCLWTHKKGIHKLLDLLIELCLQFLGIACATLNIENSNYSSTLLEGFYGDRTVIACDTGYSTRPSSDDLTVYSTQCDEFGLWTDIGHCHSKILLNHNHRLWVLLSADQQFLIIKNTTVSFNLERTNDVCTSPLSCSFCYGFSQKMKPTIL